MASASSRSPSTLPAADDLAAVRERLRASDIGEPILGAGTVVTLDRLEAASRPAQEFIVAPTLDVEVVERSVERGIPVIPAPTRRPRSVAWRSGATFVKVFPASSLGPSHVRGCGPLPEIELIATGGVDATNARQFGAGCVAVGVGGALVKGPPTSGGRSSRRPHDRPPRGTSDPRHGLHRDGCRDGGTGGGRGRLGLRGVADRGSRPRARRATPRRRMTADLRDEAAVDRTVSAAVERFGRIDGLFSAAGGSGRRFGDGPIDTLSADAWEATAALNLRTQVLMCGRVVRGDARPGAGRVRYPRFDPHPRQRHDGRPGPGAVRDARVRRRQGGVDGVDDVDGRDLHRRPDPGRPARPVIDRHAHGDPGRHPIPGSSGMRRGSSRSPGRCSTQTRSPRPRSSSWRTSRAVTGQSLAVDGGWSIVSTSAESSA